MQMPGFMPINLFMKEVMKYYADHDMEQFMNTYRKMIEAGKAAGFEYVDITSVEVELFGVDVVRNIMKAV